MPIQHQIPTRGTMTDTRPFRREPRVGAPKPMGKAAGPGFRAIFAPRIGPPRHGRRSVASGLGGHATAASMGKLLQVTNGSQG